MRVTKRTPLLAAAAVVAALRLASAQTSVDEAFARFWEAADPGGAARLVDRILRTGVTFDAAYARLRTGRTYAPHQTGQVRLSNRTGDGVDHNFVLNVPDTYDSTRRYQVRFQLHGGVMNRTDNRVAGAGTIGALAGAEQIYIIPYAWDAAPWWSDDQVLNLRAILDAAKRLYNIDENRVVVSGVSDGGTGVYYMAMRDTTPFASFLPLNGFWMVLGSDGLKVDGPIYGNNLRNKPFFIVNGGRDRLYPTELVDPHVEHFQRNGVSLVYKPQPEAGHNTQWWPEVKDDFEAFVHDHPRNPLPDTITWETSDTAAHNRAHWLVIDRLGMTASDAKTLADLNEVPISPRAEFGVQSAGGRVIRVIPGSNADRIGFKAGDALVRLNDRTVAISVDVSETLAGVAKGSRVQLLVSRNNQPVELSGIYDPPIVSYPPRKLFDRPGPSGRVDLVRDGNTVRATTRGVAAFTLLLSPDRLDFARPVTVVANGRTVFEGKVQKDLRTLLKWAAADNDRTMLFGAELHLKLD
jgi:PDZ domain-containing protein